MTLPSAAATITHRATATHSGATHSGATHSGATHSGATHSGATHSGATHSGATHSGTGHSSATHSGGRLVCDLTTADGPSAGPRAGPSGVRYDFTAGASDNGDVQILAVRNHSSHSSNSHSSNSHSSNSHSSNSHSSNSHSSNSHSSNSHSSNSHSSNSNQDVGRELASGLAWQADKDKAHSFVAAPTAYTLRTTSPHHERGRHSMGLNTLSSQGPQNNAEPASTMVNFLISRTNKGRR
eukprot:TRINITY_DN7377_c0_g1_i6.p1 TRINITY_DN7377_c0_g1~~TRINITY_DN7377_c0_g1_i6.p1  ORF type:complete len:279 (+),score=4.30 TRINITY_DN7377_c0_g1_i6:123-839(+)